MALFAQNNLWGVKDSNDRIVIPANYDQILGFDYDDMNNKLLASVRKDSLWGIVNQTGIVILFKYQQIGIFWGNKCTVCKEGKWNVINSKDETLLDNWYDTIIRLNKNRFILYDGQTYRLFDISNRTFNKISADKNGIYSKDGRTMLYPFVNNGVIKVKAGVQNLSYSISNDPDYKLKPQISNLKSIIFSEGVDKIISGWGGLLDEHKEHCPKIDISLPSTISKINSDVFEKIDSFIKHIYIPRRKTHYIKSILSDKLLKYVRVNRIFINSWADFVSHPTETFITFWLPSSPGFKRELCFIPYLIGLVYYLITGYHSYNNTFLDYHLNLIVALFVIMFSWMIGASLIDWGVYKKNRLKEKLSRDRIKLDWYTFILINFVLSFNTSFVINDIFDNKQEQDQGEICSLYLKSKNAREMHLKIGGIEGSAIYFYRYDDSFDNINYCKVHYHKGIFGWYVVDSIGH